MDHLFIAALVAFLTAVMLTWLVRHIALGLGVMDRPDGVRKLHRQPIPLMGGVAVFGGWLIGMIACQVSANVVGGHRGVSVGSAGRCFYSAAALEAGRSNCGGKHFGGERPDCESSLVIRL